jgi:hypothetical protein
MVVASRNPGQASSSATSVPPPILSDFKAEDYISALSALEAFQRLLAQTRLGPRQIPSALGAIRDGPESTFAQYQDASSLALKHIETLKSTYQSPRIRKIWLRSREVEERYRAQGYMNKLGPIEGIDVPLFGWVEKEKSLKEENGVNKWDRTQRKESTESHKTSKDEEQAIIDSLKHEFDTLEWESPAKNTLLAALQCKASRLEFRISRDTAQSPLSHGYRVHTMGIDREEREIGESISRRRQQDDLRYLLVRL